MTTTTSRFVSVQTAPVIDGISDDGHSQSRLPYPFVIREDGHVGNQSFWSGRVLHAVGFQEDLARMEIDLQWDDAVKDPEQMVGKYLVTTDSEGGMGVHETAVTSVAVMELDTDF